MVMLRLMGGLGNQLFQYAVGRSLAVKHQTDLFLDIGWFSQVPGIDSTRQFELGLFEIKAAVASHKLLSDVGGDDFSFAGRLKTKVLSAGKYGKYKFYEAGYDKKIEQVQDNSYLKGYFQSEKYFTAIENRLRHELVFKNELGYRQHPLYNLVISAKSVSLHIRRGDYTKTGTHGICSPEYYRNAIEHIKQNISGDIKIFIFSDEPAWVKEEMEIKDAVIVDNTDAGLAHIDFFLMSCCKHHIIANSSYSWWAAWLNPSKEKIVVAPEWWSATHRTKNIDLFMQGMQIL